MTYGAFYIQVDKPLIKTLDAAKATTIQGQLQEAFNNAGNAIKNFDLKSFASNLTLEGTTDFVQKYATAGLSKVINGEPITNQSMADALFNGFAPAMDMTAAQMGYNGVMEMKTALTGGNINVSGFVNGFSSALSTIVNNNNTARDYSYLGQEITIDLTVRAERQNIAETPDRRVQSGQVYSEYIHILPKIIRFEGIIKNGEKYTAVEYESLLGNVFESKKPFTFRLGEKIYENYVFTSFNPSEDFEESLKFTAEIKKIEVGEITLEKVNIPKQKTAGGAGHVVKKNLASNVGSATNKIANQTAPKKIYGIGRVMNIDQGVDSMVKQLNEWK